LKIRVTGFAGRSSAPESGAKDTRSPDASRLPNALELREAFGVRRVHRRFFGARTREGESFAVSLKFAPLDLPEQTIGLRFRRPLAFVEPDLFT
jgi:hypothetical protein